MKYINQLLEWWKNRLSDRRWRKLVKQYPVLDEILATAWRAGWRGEAWDEMLADKLFEQVPKEITLRGSEIVLQIVIAHGFGLIEKQMVTENNTQSEALRRSQTPSLN